MKLAYLKISVVALTLSLSSIASFATTPIATPSVKTTQASTPLAEEDPYGTSKFLRPYIGLSAGYDATELNAAFPDLSASANYGLNGYAYGIYGGLQLAPFDNPFRVALEGFWENVVNAQASDSGITVPAPTFQKKNNMGISLLPGYQLIDWLEIFVRLGYERSKFNYIKTAVGGYTINEYSNGFQYGLGALFSLARHVGLRAEYDRVTYSQLNYSRSGTIPALNESLDYHSNEFKLGLEFLL